MEKLSVEIITSFTDFNFSQFAIQQNAYLAR